MASPIPFKALRRYVWLLLVASPLWGAIPANLRNQIRDAAGRASLDPYLVEAVIQVESNFKPRVESSKGAVGLMQMMSETAEECGIHDRTHELNHLMGACLCLRKLINRYQGDLPKALAAYNAGPRAVDRYRGIPPFRETREYVQRVLGVYRRLSSR